MSRAAMSSAVWGIYCLLAGSGFLLLPNVILPVFGLATSDEVWIRVVGLLVAILGAYYLYCARHNVIPYFRVTVAGRYAFTLGLVSFVVLNLAQAGLLVFAAAEIAGATWTWSALRVSAHAHHGTQLEIT